MVIQSAYNNILFFRLDCTQRAAFFALLDSRSEDPNEKTSLGLFYTNCMSFGDDAALFPEMAKANHSCEPNCDFMSRIDLGTCG